MTAQETKLLNAFETTLATTLGASGTTVTLTAVTDSASNNIEAPCYLVIEPDSATQREYVLVSAINISTKTITLGDGGASYRYLKGSAATSGLSHASGSTIRYVAMAQHFEDLNDRIDANFNEAGTEIVAGNAVKDEDTMSSDSAVHLATQQSIKAYVDSQVTAQDLDFAGDSGTGQVDLDSQTFTIAGTLNEIETSALDQTITIGLPSSITVDVVGNLTGNVTGNVTGNLTGNVTGDLTGDVTGNVTGNVTGDVTGDVTGNLTGNVTGNLTGDTTGNVTATSVLADGVTATTQTAGDNSTKVATTAYVDSVSVDDDLNFAGDSGTGTVDLDTQTFTVEGTTNEIVTSATGQALTIGLPSSITVDVVGNLTGNADTATTAGALSSAVTVSLTGDVAGSATFTSAGDTATITTIIQADSVALGTDTTGNYVEDVTTSATSGLNKTSSAGEGQDVDLVIDPSQLADGTSITVDTSNDFLILEDVTDGSVYKVNPDQIASGSANALIDGTSDLTITDGTGLDYDISGTDVASWEAGGIALTTNGGIFRHNQTQAGTYTVAANEGSVMAGPITITGTVTNNGTLVVI